MRRGAGRSRTSRPSDVSLRYGCSQPAGQEASARGVEGPTGGDPDRETLTLVPTKRAGAYYETPEGDFWRAYLFIEGAQTYDTVENLAHIHNAGRAFGHFQKQFLENLVNLRE